MRHAHFVTGAATHVGRRYDNADAWSTTAARIVVCDGAGALGTWSAREAVQAAMHTPHGDLGAAITAAGRAVTALGAAAASTILVAELTTPNGQIRDRAHAVTVVDQDVTERAAAGPVAVPAPGADVTVADGQEPDAVVVTVAHVGDTRCLYLAADAGCSWLTDAHNGAAELVANGLIDPSEAATHTFRHRLTRSLGSTAANPDIRQIAVNPGDRLVVVTDGVHAVLDLPTIEDLARTPNVEAAAAALVSAAWDRGSTDNMTAVVTEIAVVNIDDITGGCDAR